MLMKSRFTRFLDDDGTDRYGYVKLYLMRRQLRGIPKEIEDGIYKAFRYPFDDFLTITLQWKPYTLQVLKFLKEQLKYYQYNAHIEHIRMIREGKNLNEEQRKNSQEYLEACWKIQYKIEHVINEM